MAGELQLSQSNQISDWYSLSCGKPEADVLALRAQKDTPVRLAFLQSDLQQAFWLFCAGRAPPNLPSARRPVTSAGAATASWLLLLFVETSLFQLSFRRHYTQTMGCVCSSGVSETGKPGALSSGPGQASQLLCNCCLLSSKLLTRLL